MNNQAEIVKLKKCDSYLNVKSQHAAKSCPFDSEGFVGVHIGAGQHSEARTELYLEICASAIKAAIDVLREGGSALEAAEKATIVLEDAGETNAGYGSNLTESGTLEMDAGIMDGKNLLFGAVGAISRIKNPIRVARKLVDEQAKGLLPLGRVPPGFLVGEGARDWAVRHGISTISTDKLVSDKAVKLYKHYKKKLDTYKQSVEQNKRKKEADKDEADAPNCKKFRVTHNLAITEQVRSSDGASKMVDGSSLDLEENFQKVRKSVSSTSAVIWPSLPHRGVSSASLPGLSTSRAGVSNSSGCLPPMCAPSPSYTSYIDPRRSSLPTPPGTHIPTGSERLVEQQHNNIYIPAPTATSSNMPLLHPTIDSKLSNKFSGGSNCDGNHELPESDEVGNHEMLVGDRVASSDLQESKLPESEPVAKRTNQNVKNTSLPYSEKSNQDSINLHNYKSKVVVVPHDDDEDVVGDKDVAVGENDVVVGGEKDVDDDCVQDTVGVVVLDRDGNVAASVSSGGIALKQSGRVGQASCYGCGCWAQKQLKNTANSVAVSTTGCGEHLVRTLLARECGQCLANSTDPMQSIQNTMKEKFAESEFLRGINEKLGGAICLQFDKNTGIGNFLWTHTTHSMGIGFQTTRDAKAIIKMSRLPKDMNVQDGTTILVESISFTTDPAR